MGFIVIEEPMKTPALFALTIGLKNGTVFPQDANAQWFPIDGFYALIPEGQAK